MRPTKPIMVRPRTHVNHKGLVTHHQDQSITCVNFNTNNNKKNTVVKSNLLDRLLFNMLFI